MSPLYTRCTALTLASLLWACPAPKGPETPAEPAAPAAPTGAAASQPAGAASQPGTPPAGHPETSSKAVSLKAIFAMPKLEGDLVARVGGREVKGPALQHELLQMQIQLGATGLPESIDRPQVLSGAVARLVDQQMLIALADDLGVKPDPSYAKAWLDDLEKRMKAQPSFKVFLLRAGKDDAQRKKDAQQEALRRAVVDKIRAQVKGETEAQAKDYYARHTSDFTLRGGTEMWRIFIKAPRGMVQRDRDIARGRVEGLLEKAKKNPKNFPNLAISHSEGGKAPGGGYIGWVAPGTLAPDLEKKAFAAKPNSVLLWEDASGFFIYKVGKTRKTKVREFDEVADEILEKVYRTTINTKLEAELKRLKDATKIDVLIPELKKS